MKRGGHSKCELGASYTQKGGDGTGAHLRFAASRSAHRRVYRDHGHASVLRRSHESASGCSTAHGHGVRVLQRRHWAMSLCRRCFHVSAAVRSLPSCGIYVVTNERGETCTKPAGGS